MIEKSGKISIRRQCELLKINRSSLFYKKKMPSRDIEISRKIKEIHERIPFYGYRKVTHELRRQGILVNLKKIQRVMHKNMIFALRPKKKRKTSASTSYKADFLLKDVKIQRPNQVWSTDISYIKMTCGYIYLSSIVDVYSRKIVGSNISTILDANLCLQTLNNALKNHEKPQILNTDQGSQYMSKLWRDALKTHEIQSSMDGKGRWADNVYIERIWRTIKQESIFLQKFQSVKEAKTKIFDFIEFYNTHRLHQNLHYKTPNEVYNEDVNVDAFIYAKRNKSAL